MNSNANTPYANLDPHVILDAIESIGFQCTGGLTALNSYENRVYQVSLENGSVIIAKFYRPNRWSDETILEEHEFALELMAHEIPVVAPLMSENQQTLHYYQNFRFALFPRWRGRALAVDNLDQLEWMGRFIGRLHAVGAVKKFQHRITLDVNTYGYESYQFLIENNFIPKELKTNYCVSVEKALQEVQRHFHEAGSIEHIRLHGDLHAGNVLWNEEGPHIVDLDDCLMGPAIQDIWMLLSGDETHVKLQLKRILDGYRKFHDFNTNELKLIESLRTLRMLQHSAWIARRWEDPTFPLNFPWFNTPRYWQDQLHHINEQLEVLE